LVQKAIIRDRIKKREKMDRTEVADNFFRDLKARNHPSAIKLQGGEESCELFEN
jgi:hypothetical protein